MRRSPANPLAFVILALTLLLAVPAVAEDTPRPPAALGNATAREPYGIGLEGFAYPYPVEMFDVVNDGEQLRMAFMDVAPRTTPNGRAVLLLHGRNFPSSYWAPVIKTLTSAGYRVIVPDQVGFGKSSKPTGELHFDTLARNTIALLDHLQLTDIDIVAHSLGGMLAVRIARAYPDRVRRLMLVAPIGLEDYRLYVAPTPTEKILENEDRLTAEAYRKQLVTNYSLALPPEAITPFIEARFNIKGAADYPRWLRAFVSSAQMIYREPVAHEIALIIQPTLFFMGENDHNAPGRPNAPEALRPKMGHNAELAQGFARAIAERQGRGDPGRRAPGVSRSRGRIQQGRARIPWLALTTLFMAHSLRRCDAASNAAGIENRSHVDHNDAVPRQGVRRSKKQKEILMKLIVAATLLGSLIAGTSFANAMPLGPASQGLGADVIQVAGGCGPGLHRGPYGGCRPNRGPVVVVPGRHYVPAPYVRRCPPGTFMGRYGRCRPY